MLRFSLPSMWDLTYFIGYESSTSFNLGNDHGFVIKESIGIDLFGETQSKAMRAYV